MIKHYHTLKRHCNLKYSIDNKEFKIGDLTDKQLDISEKIFKRKDKLTDNEKLQLKAIQYVSRYRSGKALEKLELDIVNRRNERAIKTATIISDWIEKVYTTREQKVIKI